LDRASDFGSEGCRFKSCRMHQPSPAACQRAKAAAPERLARRRAVSEIRPAGYGSARQNESFMDFHYVYILRSVQSPEHFYVGFTEDLKQRLAWHNAGHVPHTSKFRPWEIKTAIAFTERQAAAEFEKYLKTASGRAFAKKRL
jgi:putative endonuclease